MLTGQSILCFAPGPWRDLWRSRHQIMSRLARSNTVLWVEPRLTLRQTRRAMARTRLTWLPQVEHIRDRLYVFHNPALLPASGPLGFSAVTGAIYQAILRRTLADLGMTRPILWLYLPEMVGIIGRYDERLIVYHVVDEYSTYGGIPVAYVPTMQRLERQLLSQADVTIVTAPALLESKRPYSRTIHLVPNAVDYDGFQHTLAGADVPAEMAALPAPIIGYVGAINDKLDYTLLATVARHRPGWSLALVGPVDVRTPEDIAGFETLRVLPNVHFLGPVAVDDVPRYIAACQVCLVPYKINERTRYISSLKLYEYLACGKPVVSTDVPAAHEGGGTVRIATAEMFVVAIEQALADDPAAAEERRRIAAANTWEQRVETISALLSPLV